MMKVLGVVILSIALLFVPLPITASQSPENQEPDIRLTVTFLKQNRYSNEQYAPANIQYKVQIKPHHENIWYCVGWISEDAYIHERRSCQQLNGIVGPKTFWMEYKGVGEGHYEAFAEFYRAPNRLVGIVTYPFRVLPPIGG